MNSSPISQQISQNEIDGNNCLVLQAVNDNNDNFLIVQMDDLKGLEEISTSTVMEIERPKMLGEDDIIGGMPRKGNGTSNITPQKCQQHLRKKRESNIGRKCMMVMQQFLFMTASDENFYHAIEIDENGVCRSLLWAYGRAREIQPCLDAPSYQMNRKIALCGYLSSGYSAWGDTFFAGMRSSQRSESINSFFDGYVNFMTSLSEFVGQYAKALQCHRDEEVNEDMWTMRAKPSLCHLHKLEVRAGMVYTRKIFVKFQSEFKDSLYCVHDEVATNDGMTTYDVSYGFGGKVDSHSVPCGPSKEEFACTCGKFETSVHDQVVSHGKLYTVATVVVEDLKRKLYSIRKELEGLVTEQSEQDFGAQAISQDLISSNIDIRDPERFRTKGRPKELSRIPVGKQVSQNTAHIRRWTCSTCGIKGHDSRTCGKTKDKQPAAPSLRRPSSATRSCNCKDRSCAYVAAN
ncbi:hypothetical protein SLEP1_g57346 [Rubroshorea leprosula]|uniref:Protein FAR1-RELATED SEQUENCE n=1 Tax=Rubroshorea leprosula TaxID=152421 RepID=A0AAV5MLE1_9ROSI|nr:hypothetical protein SLEP1_g57346 [Rubroshorea leprosula]